MKVLHILCLVLSAACLEARLLRLRQEPNSNPCPVPDPLTYTVHLPHPWDCNMFLRCDHGIAKPERCPAFLHFNPVSQVCEWPGKAGCKVYATDSNNLDPEFSQAVNENENPQPDNQIQEQVIPDGGNADAFIPNVNENENPQPDNQIQEQLIPGEGNADVFIPNEWIQSGNIPAENVQNEQNSGGDVQNDQPLDAEITNGQTPDENLPVNEVDDVYLQNEEKAKNPIIDDVLDEEIFPESNPE